MAFIVHELCSFLWRLCLGLLDMVLSNSLFLSIHSPAQRTPVNRTTIALFSNEILRAVKAFRILLIIHLGGIWFVKTKLLSVVRFMSLEPHSSNYNVWFINHIPIGFQNCNIFILVWFITFLWIVQIIYIDWKSSKNLKNYNNLRNEQK